MKILACLGNAEKKYVKTRHNIGFIIGASFAEKAEVTINKKMFSSTCGTGKVNGESILVLFPQTYMNSSGTAVLQALDYYREEPWNLIVIHDEIEAPFGEYSVKFGGGHRGHNGLRSIIEKIGTPDFHRLRFGVGRPIDPHLSVADHVLSRFDDDELNKISGLLPHLNDILIKLISERKNIN